jgi:hypothetical protein
MYDIYCKARTEVKLSKPSFSSQIFSTTLNSKSLPTWPSFPTTPPSS